MAIKLNQNDILEKIFLNVIFSFYYCKLFFLFIKIPINFVPIISKNIPLNYVEKLLVLISIVIEKNNYIEYCLIWVENILFNYSNFFQTINPNSRNILKLLLKNINLRFSNIKQM